MRPYARLIAYLTTLPESQASGSLPLAAQSRSRRPRLPRASLITRKATGNFMLLLNSIILTLALAGAALPRGLAKAGAALAPQIKGGQKGNAGGGGKDIAPNASAMFSNATSITIPASGAASLYPSNITVAGLTGTVENVVVKLNGLSHVRPDDIDILLVGPTGANLIIMSDVGGSNAVTNLTIALDDLATASLPDSAALSSGTFKPTNSGTGDTFAAPAPAASANTTFSAAFDGTNPNGTWSLYVFDDANNNGGSISGGWSLNILTRDTFTGGSITIPDNTVASPYPSTINVSGLGSTISKVTVVLTNMTHTFPDDIAILLVSPGGQKVILMEDAGGASNITNVSLTFDDAAAASLADNAQLVTGTFKPTVGTPNGGSIAPPTNFTAPAPASPYARTLASFIGSNPNGTWSLYVLDDTAQDIGTIASWSLIIASPTAVEMASFASTAYDDGVFLEWQTGYEVNNLGFNIYRDESGKRSRISPSIIAGSALMAGPGTALTAGRQYAWWDAAAKGKQQYYATYWIEDIDLNGTRTMHGPVIPRHVGGKPPERSSADLLSRATNGEVRIGQPALAGQSLRLSATPPSNSLQAQWEIAAKAAVKIMIRKEGWYRVNQPDLAAAGLDVSRDPRLLQMFVDGLEQPILVKGGLSGRLEPSDYIEFYATGLDTSSTDVRTYWLMSGQQFGRRISKASSSGNPVKSQSFSFTVERRERSVYFVALKNGDTDNWFGPILTSEPVTQAITLEHLDRDSSVEATVEVALQGVTDLPGSDLDHSVRVLLNGSDIGSVSFDGQARQVSKLAITNRDLREGDNTVTLASQNGETDISLLDYVRITYAHSFKADNSPLRLNASGGEAMTIGGFPSAPRVMDITDPYNTQEVLGLTRPQADGYEITVAPPDQAPRILLAFGDGQAMRPDGVIANRPSAWNLKSQGADLMIISHKDFIPALGPLAELRRKQGYSTAVADVEDIYDEFGYGNKSPQAIKDFLTYARSWKKPPRFVMLVGDSSSDPRNYLGLGNWDFTPTKLVDTSQMETASDDWLADFNNDGLPDIAIGRLPARSAAEASLLVSKIVNYDTSLPEGVLLVADRNDDYNFEIAASRARNLIPAQVAVEQVFRSQMDDSTARDRIIDGINRGPKIVNYLGHGSFGLWRGNLMTNADAAQLRSEAGLSFILAMTCLNGQFQDPYADSLAEALLKSQAGGAVAVWASSALTEPNGQDGMNQELLRLIFGGGSLTLGEAAMKAKAAVGDNDIRRSWIFFGDPTTRLR